MIRTGLIWIRIMGSRLVVSRVIITRTRAVVGCTWMLPIHRGFKDEKVTSPITIIKWENYHNGENHKPNHCRRGKNIREIQLISH